MDAIADDGAEHHRAEIDDEEIGRSHSPLEMSAPQHEAQHVHGEVDEVDMQEAIGEQAPVLMPRDCARIHAAIAIQQLCRRRRTTCLDEAESRRQDGHRHQRVKGRMRNFEEAGAV